MSYKLFRKPDKSETTVIFVDPAEEIEVYEEWGKLDGRVYRQVWVWKKDKRYKIGKRKHYLIQEWLEELPYVKHDEIPFVDMKYV